MAIFRTIKWIRLVANRVKGGNIGLFSASIHKIVTLSITIGTATILVAIMVMMGFQNEIKTKITAFSGDFEVAKYSGTPNPYEPIPLEGMQLDVLSGHFSNAIEQIVPFIQKIMLFHTKGEVEGILCKGIASMAIGKTLADYLIEGRLPDLTKPVYQNELCISDHLAKKLSIHLGDTIIAHTLDATIRYRKLKVVGIYCTYLADIDEHLAFCDMRLIQRLNNWSPETVNGYTIFLKPHVLLTKGLQNAMLDCIDGDVALISTQRKYINFYDWLAIIQKNTIIFMVFILLIAGFTMVATVMIQIMERSYMVGLLKVLGAYDWQIHMILLYNSLHTLSMGILYGNILGMGLCVLQNHYKWIALEPSLYYMRYVPIYIDYKVLLLLNLLIIISIFVALYIAVKLLKQQKLLEALHQG